MKLSCNVDESGKITSYTASNMANYENYQYVFDLEPNQVEQVMENLNDYKVINGKLTKTEA